MSLRISVILTLACCAFLVDDGPGDQPAEQPTEPAAQSLQQQRQSLAKLQPYVGRWSGVGQVRRGSSHGAWTEAAEVAWQWKDDEAALVATSPKAKFFSTMRFVALDGKDGFQMIGTRGGKEPEASVRYEGRLGNASVLELAVVKPTRGFPDRIKVRLAAGAKRLMVLYERKSGSRFARMAEVGFTRRGSGFASGSTGVECVVTGGTGTIPVRFEGKTYFVCCSGCKEYFDDDPAKTMREYRERKAEEKAEASARER